MKKANKKKQADFILTLPQEHLPAANQPKPPDARLATIEQPEVDGITSIGKLAPNACLRWARYRLTTMLANVEAQINQPKMLSRERAHSLERSRANLLADLERTGEQEPLTGMPGLDADLCRCTGCTARYPRGIWWVDRPMRDRVFDTKGRQITSDIEADLRAS